MAVNEYGRRGVETLINIFFPNICPMCNAPISKGEGFCSNCIKEVKLILDDGCKKCGKYLKDNEALFCGECNENILDRNISLFYYEGAIKQSLYRFKYKNFKSYAKNYSVYLKDYINIVRSWKAKVLIPIPVHTDKLNNRGYNQAKVFSKELSTILNIPVRNDILKRVIATTPQKGLSRQGRYDNLIKAFGVNKDLLNGIDVAILVDDIYTTGSTMDICAKLLKGCGVKKVYGICIATGRA